VKAGRKILLSERDTYNRLWELAKQRKLYLFFVPKPNKWEIFLDEDAFKAAGGVKRREVDRVYLTQAEVRARFEMDKKPEPVA
jgi:hypothetical protein